MGSRIYGIPLRIFNSRHSVEHEKKYFNAKLDSSGFLILLHVLWKFVRCVTIKWRPVGQRVVIVHYRVCAPDVIKFSNRKQKGH